jgi:hypothetical protein
MYLILAGFLIGPELVLIWLCVWLVWYGLCPGLPWVPVGSVYARAGLVLAPLCTGFALSSLLHYLSLSLQLALTWLGLGSHLVSCLGWFWLLHALVISGFVVA